MQAYWQDLPPSSLHRLIVEHQPKIVAANLGALGIKTASNPSDILKALDRLKAQDYGSYAEQLSMVLDVPIEEGGKGYQQLMSYGADGLGAIALTNALIHAPIEQELIGEDELYHLRYWSKIGYYALGVLLVLLILLFLMRE